MNDLTVSDDPDWKVVDANTGGALTPASSLPGYTVYRCVYCNIKFVVEDDEHRGAPEWCPHGCEHDDASDRGLAEVEDA